uniref:Uncharacterized protein n=1 Tax=Ascaris lumbricoides TaxID=6252 RepID=A0A0M3HPB7_ASCLU
MTSLYSFNKVAVIEKHLEQAKISTLFMRFARLESTVRKMDIDDHHAMASNRPLHKKSVMFLPKFFILVELLTADSCFSFFSALEIKGACFRSRDVPEATLRRSNPMSQDSAVQLDHDDKVHNRSKASERSWQRCAIQVSVAQMSTSQHLRCKCSIAVFNTFHGLTDGSRENR